MYPCPYYYYLCEAFFQKELMRYVVMLIWLWSVTGLVEMRTQRTTHSLVNIIESQMILISSFFLFTWSQLIQKTLLINDNEVKESNLKNKEELIQHGSKFLDPLLPSVLPSFLPSLLSFLIKSQHEDQSWGIQYWRW